MSRLFRLVSLIITRSPAVSTNTPLKLGYGSTTIRTGGRSDEVSTVLASFAACAAAAFCSCASRSSMVQMLSLAAAACISATNICSSDGPPACVAARKTAPTTKALQTTTGRRITLFAPRIKMLVGAGEHGVDDPLDRLPRIRRVILHVVARRVDARHLRPPVFLQQFVGIAVARRER